MRLSQKSISERQVVIFQNIRKPNNTFLKTSCVKEFIRREVRKYLEMILKKHNCQSSADLGEREVTCQVLLLLIKAVRHRIKTNHICSSNRKSKTRGSTHSHCSIFPMECAPVEGQMNGIRHRACFIEGSPNKSFQQFQDRRWKNAGKNREWKSMRCCIRMGKNIFNPLYVNRFLKA